MDLFGVSAVWTFTLAHFDLTWVGLDHSLSIYPAPAAANNEIDRDTEDHKHDNKAGNGDDYLPNFEAFVINSSGSLGFNRSIKLFLPI